jgi:RNA polymerase sigma factor (sigma-70 family)
MEQEDVGGNHKESEEEPLLDIDIDDESDQQNNEGPQGMGHLQDLTNDDLEIDSYKIDSILHTTAVEESALWRKYIKWRHIQRIPGSEIVLKDIPKASSIVIYGCNLKCVISRIIKEISSSHDLIVLLRHHVGLDKLGDTIIEDAEDHANVAIELYRLIQHSKEKHGNKMKQNNSESCCLEDLFGFMLGQTLNNIAFGKGNPDLVGKIAKAINLEPTYVKAKLFGLAVNRELLPRSLVNLFDPKTPVSELPNLIESISTDSFSEFVLNNYRSFISNIRSEGEKAFSRIIESHLWLVVDIAKKHIDKALDLPLDDLIQEGSVGLIEAAKTFRPTRGTRFMQYAYWWILRGIQRGIADKARIIRIPVHMLETIERLQRISDDLAWKYGRDPTHAEIAEEMKISVDEVTQIFQFLQLPLSRESTIAEEEDSNLGDSIEDLSSLYPVDIESRQLLRKQIEEVFSTLSPREQQVLELRFGLEDGRSRTLEEVGKEFNVTRERIRQIEAKALSKLRHPSRSRKLKEYLE